MSSARRVSGPTHSETLLVSPLSHAGEPGSRIDRERLVRYAGCFPAEDLQLYYQIALQGRQDLELAPDEHGGFAMTLLRLLAFRPEGGNEADMLPLARPAGAAKTRVETTTEGKAGAGEFDGDWTSLARRLPLSGAAKQLALNSVLAGFSGWAFELRVAPAMEYLCAYQDKIKAALEQFFGRPVRVRVALGELAGGATVAAQEAGARDERQAHAVQTVRQDRFVRELEEKFDGTVINASIRPRQQG